MQSYQFKRIDPHFSSDDYYFDPNDRRDKIYQAPLRETSIPRKSSGSP